MTAGDRDAAERLPPPDHRVGLDVDLLDDPVVHDAVGRAADRGQVSPNGRGDCHKRSGLVALVAERELV